MKSNSISLTGIVKPGHRVASGQGENSPYEQGTLEMQLPYFRDLGLDISSFYLGTINISIAPHIFKPISPKYTFSQVKWHPDYPAETFSFSPSRLVVENVEYNGLVYYPHPETKIGHFQDDGIVEIIAPKIPNLNYGDRLTVKLNLEEIQVTPFGGKGK